MRKVSYKQCVPVNFRVLTFTRELSVVCMVKHRVFQGAASAQSYDIISNKKTAVTLWDIVTHWNVNESSPGFAALGSPKNVLHYFRPFKIKYCGLKCDFV